MVDIFITAIHEKKKVRITFFSKEDQGQLTRLCAPMDYGESRRAKDKSPRFHSWDYESDEGKHTLSLLPNQVKNIELTDEAFEPSEFVSWKPNWIVARDWGMYS